MRRIWEAFLSSTPECRSHWVPSVDVYSGRHRWLVKLDLAGVRPEDVDIEACGRTLTVRGVRRDLSVLEHGQAYSMEIAYNRFARTIELPFDLDRTRIRTEYQHGMVLVNILLGTGDEE